MSGDTAWTLIKEKPKTKSKSPQSPQWPSSTKNVPSAYNVPGPSEDGESIHKDKVRTRAQPGGDHPPLPTSTVPSRRPGLYAKQRYDDLLPSDEEILAVFKTAAIKGKPYPGPDRQKEQRGQAKRYFEKWYRENRSRVKTRMKKWYTKHKNQGAYKRDQKRREDNPEKFKRRPGGPSSVKERSKEYREEQKKKKASALLTPVPFYHIPTGKRGFVTRVSQQTGSVTIRLGGEYKSLDLLEFFDVAVVGEEIDYFFSHLDGLFNERRATFYYEKMERDDTAEYDRAHPFKLEETVGQKTWEPPKVKENPDGLKFIRRRAYTLAEVMEDVGNSLPQKAENLPVKLRRVDARNGVWLFDVKGGSGVYRVRVRGRGEGNVRKFSKADIYLSCSCPFWRWQGPEHWAKKEGYLFGKPRGTASVPSIKDPEHKHAVCKHVLAVLNRATRKDWRIPKRRSEP